MYHSWTNSRVKRCTLFFKSAPEKTYNSRKWIVPGVQKKKNKKQKKNHRYGFTYPFKEKEYSGDNMPPKRRSLFFLFQMGFKIGSGRGGVMAKFHAF